MVTLSQNSVYLLGLLTGVITGIMTGVAALVELIPAMKQNQDAFNWTVRAANGALCLLAIFGVEAAQNTFDLHHWVAYVLTAVAMAAGSHVLYIGTTARTRAQLNRATQTFPAAPSAPAANLAPEPVSNI
jgi:hypothetical protein